MCIFPQQIPQLKNEYKFVLFRFGFLLINDAKFCLVCYLYDWVGQNKFNYFVKFVKKDFNYSVSNKFSHSFQVPIQPKHIMPL